MKFAPKYLKRSILVIFAGAVACSVQKMDLLNSTEDSSAIVYTADFSKIYQTVHNFGASDAWSMQFVGKNWPENDRQRIAQLLFSTETDQNGRSLGVGLSAWRFNIGGGSAEQGAESKIEDEWRRAECFLESDGTYNWERQAGQQWFLQQAKEYGVKDFVGFVNTPPVYLTRNGKAWSQDGLKSNLDASNATAYSKFLVEVIKGIETKTGVELNYISPFNEPQWEWTCCKQEGSPWNNDELAATTRIISAALLENGLATKIDLTEAGQINYLYEKRSVDARSNQLEDFYLPGSEKYLMYLSNVAPKVCGHSYWSTWDYTNLINSRKNFRKQLETINPELEYWMSEYCILEDNAEINGNKRDLGIDAALYLAKVIQADLVLANASAWHWWLAVSPYNYKDGLIYIDKNKYSGKIYESKMLWSLGHFSKFIRPESKRIEISRKDGELFENHLNELSTSGYITPDNKMVVVHINQSNMEQSVKIDGVAGKFDKMCRYITTAAEEDNLRLADTHAASESILIPARSIVTCVYE